MEEIILGYQSPRRTVNYELRRTEESELLGGKTDNTSHLYFSLSYEGKREGMDCFVYRVSHFSQTNHSGLYAWLEDLHPITEDLVLGISGQGRIERIFNRKEIHRMWDRKIWDKVEKKHKKEDNCDSMIKNVDNLLRDEQSFANSLRYAPPFCLLFSGLHGMLFEREKVSERTSRLPGFMGVPYLPLILEDEIKTSENTGESFEIKSTGNLDKDDFDEGNFRSFVRTLSNDPTAVSDLLTRHSERYLFDEKHWVKYGMLLHLSTVPYFMMREERCMLKALES